MNPYALNLSPVSRVGLGCAAISREGTTDSQAEKTMLAAWQQGIRLFDTAPMYGSGLSELRVGRTLRGVARDKYVLSTKVGRLVDDITADGYGRGWHYDFSRDGILRSVEASFTRLGVDRADVLYLHDADQHWETALHEALPTLYDLRDQGMVRAIGVGMTQAPMLARFAREAAIDIFLVAGRYSLLDRTAMDELLPLCEEKGIAVVIAQMLHGGLIEGVSDPQLYYRPVDEATRKNVARIAEVCRRFGVPMAAAAIQFPLLHPAVTGVLTGPNTADQVAENLGWLDVTIPDELWGELIAAGLLDPAVPVPGKESIA